MQVTVHSRGFKISGNEHDNYTAVIGVFSIQIIAAYSHTEPNKLRSQEAYVKHSCGLGFAYTPKVCRIIAFLAILTGFGLLFYLLLGSR